MYRYLGVDESLAGSLNFGYIHRNVGELGWDIWDARISFSKVDGIKRELQMEYSMPLARQARGTLPFISTQGGLVECETRIYKDCPVQIFHFDSLLEKVGVVNALILQDTNHGRMRRIAAELHLLVPDI